METASIAMAAGLSFLITWLSGKWLIPWLKKLKFGQKILEDGPVWHMAKQNIPTMGGILFILGISVATIGICVVRDDPNQVDYLVVLLMALCFGFIGFIDDFTKVVKKRNKGLSAPQKLILQVAISVVCLTSFRINGTLDPVLQIPFTSFEIELNWWVYVAFCVFIIVGAVNAVNLTDGLDGLVTSVTLPVAILFTAAFLILYNYPMAVLGAALAGGLIGFLIYNFYPAKAFMGDTGSLFLGGMVCGLAFALNFPLLLAPLGIIYIVEALSVILQVGYFKLTHGKRLFKMAPLHHHFEMKGYRETQIVLAATLISLLAAVAAFVALLMNYKLI